MTTKVRASAHDALDDLRDGASIMCGGFGLSGNPEALIDAVLDKGTRELTLISNNAGSIGLGLAKWLQAGVVSRVICSFIGNNADLLAAHQSGDWLAIPFALLLACSDDGGGVMTGAAND